MDDKLKTTYSNIVSINPYSDLYFKSTSNFLIQINSPSYNKESFYISYLNTKSFITAKIDISKNILEEDLEDTIISKIYDELALDQTIIYQINFIELANENDDKNRYFHIFVIDSSILDEIYKSTIKKIKYIDVIIPSPLLLKSLYVKNIIKSSGVHCFIYFQESEAFVTIYDKKEFVYTKSINYSITDIYERFCELYGEKVNYDDFKDFLLTEDLKSTKSDYKKNIIKLYKEILVNINEILTYVKRAYEIETIEHLYIGTQIPIKIKLNEIAEFEMDIECSDFSFDYGFDNNQNDVSQLHYLMHIYASLDSNERYDCNFTTFPRPPKFIKRDSGKFLLFIFISFIIAAIYPIFYLGLSYSKVFEYNLLESEYTKLHIKKNDIEIAIKAKESNKNIIYHLLKKEEDNYNDKKNTLIKIEEIKVNYPMKAKILSVLVEDLGKFNVNLESLSYAEDEKNKYFIFNLVSLNNKNITNLIKYITKKYNGKYDFSTQNIVYKDNYGKYFSDLKVTIL